MIKNHEMIREQVTAIEYCLEDNLAKGIKREMLLDLLVDAKAGYLTWTGVSIFLFRLNNVPTEPTVDTYRSEIVGQEELHAILKQAKEEN